MSSPTNPTNGQTANINGVVYTYSTALTAWTVTSNFSGNVTVDQINANAVVSAGSLGGTTITGTSVSVSGNITGANLTTGGSLSVTGTTSLTGNVTGGNATVSTSLAVGATTPSGTAGEIRATNAITSYYSDERLKNRIGNIEQALNKIDQLHGFLYIENTLAKNLGFDNPNVQVALSAQDVKRVQPEAVRPAPFDIDVDGSSKSGQNYLTVQYDRLVPLLVEGIKELRKELKEIKILVDSKDDNSANNN